MSFGDRDKQIKTQLHYQGHTCNVNKPRDTLSHSEHIQLPATEAADLINVLPSRLPLWLKTCKAFIQVPPILLFILFIWLRHWFVWRFHFLLKKKKNQKTKVILARWKVKNAFSSSAVTLLLDNLIPQNMWKIAGELEVTGGRKTTTNKQISSQ